ncbi:MAG TPA: hypothetical protein VNN73_19840 [Blastocatellia bacterium]|nr:hypothetical protein [Blastocatellia bacterium]
MDDRPSHPLRSFLIELVIYAALVVAYVFFVLHLLEHWLQDIYGHSKVHYAIAALALIVGQGVVLEMITSALLRFIRSRNE